MVHATGIPAGSAYRIPARLIEKPRAVTHPRPVSNHAPRSTPLLSYIRPHVERDVSRNVSRKADSGAQRFRACSRARRRDAAVRVWRGHAAPDDALRGELRAVRDLLHSLSRRSFSGRDRLDPHAGVAGAGRADAALWAEGGEEGAHAGH